MHIYINRLIFSPLAAGLSIAIILILLSSPVSSGQDTIQIIIDTKALTLKVMQGDQETLSFSDIAIGRYGADTDRRRGDSKTPLGLFSIAWITDNSSFHRFFGFNFPTKEYAERAFREGQMDQKTLDKIRQAFAAGRLPPQDTVLGGNLGIHGIGRGDIKIHQQYNWTNGCVALTNDQIDRLTAWVKVGTSVEIH
ncbi:MAG: L,D-transpeptidase family protein [Desulforhopalus sp.]|nr:L,D-transpeptidase family protein [Desulforhopalus sp.]